jgi:L-threonylcarbamoyladenylate synthase
LLRPGGTTVEEIECILEKKVLHFENIKKTSTTDQYAIHAPGMMKRHYAPSIPLRLNVLSPNKGEAFLGFDKTNTQPTLNLSESGDLMQAAVNLFKMMRELDVPIYSGIAVAPIPKTGIGLAINDRLNRAACLED